MSKYPRAKDAWGWQGANPDYYIALAELAKAFNRFKGHDFRLIADGDYITPRTCSVFRLMREAQEYDCLHFVEVFDADAPEDDGARKGWFRFDPGGGVDAIGDYTMSLAPYFEDAA